MPPQGKSKNTKDDKGEPAKQEWPPARIFEKLVDTIPRVRTTVQVIAFVAVVVGVVLLVARQFQAVPIILTLVTIVVFVISWRIPWDQLGQRHPAVILAALLIVAIAVIGLVFVAFILARQSPPQPVADDHRWSNSARRPLAELIDNVRVRDGVAFTFTGQANGGAAVESRVRDLVLCYEGRIKGEDWGEVFEQLGRRYPGCLVITGTPGGRSITVTLKEGTQVFELKDGCHECVTAAR